MDAMWSANRSAFRAVTCEPDTCWLSEVQIAYYHEVRRSEQDQMRYLLGFHMYSISIEGSLNKQYTWIQIV